MKNIIFIKETNYNDTLVGQQLNNILDYCVYVNGKSCCDCESMRKNDLMVNLVLDNIRYLVNNFILAGKFENIVISWEFDDEMLEKLISKIDSDGYSITIFSLTNTEVDFELPEMELKNKEYHSDYVTMANDKLVKYSCIDTTDCSAFKIAKQLEKAIAK